MTTEPTPSLEDDHEMWLETSENASAHFKDLEFWKNQWMEHESIIVSRTLIELQSMSRHHKNLLFGKQQARCQPELAGFLYCR